MQLWRYGKPIESLNGGRYVLEGVLGSGGMAEVWKAYDEHEMRDVAIKILNPDLVDQETMNRFVKEAGQVVGWQNPHILKIYDHMQIERLDANHLIFYIVMEYAKGGDLQKRLTPGKPYSLRATFTIVRQLCDAVAYAHRQGVIHRDIKPLNVLFRQPRTGPEEVVLSDFGLAVQVDASHHTFAEAGTLAYMAPEQFRGQAEPASDIFALGVILYRMCTGKLPFHRSLQELSLLMAGEEPFPPAPSTLNPALPPRLDGVILCALEADPIDRYRSAEELWKTIALALQKSVLPSERRMPRQAPSTQPPVERTTNVPSSLSRSREPGGDLQTRKMAQSHQSNFTDKNTIPPKAISLPSTLQVEDQRPRRISRRFLIGAGTAAVVAVGGGAALFAHILTPSQKTLQPTSTAIVHQRTPSPSPSQLGTPISSSAPIYTYTGHDKDTIVFGLSWSPKGTQIASSDSGVIGSNGFTVIEPATVQVWDATTGQHRLVYTFKGDQSTGRVAWSPKGTQIAFCTTGTLDRDVRIWTPATNQVITYLATAPTAGPSPNALAWSPDSSMIAVGRLDGTIEVVNPNTGSSLFLLHGHTKSVGSVAWSPGGSMIASGSSDNTVRVWNASTRQLLFTYTGHGQGVDGSGVLSVSWSPNGQQIASSGLDGTIQVWDATNGHRVVTHHCAINSSV
jgi:serine/threonine protein kinase